MLHCEKCGASWEPRKKDGGLPVQCPRCKRVDWQEPKNGGSDVGPKNDVGRGAGGDAADSSGRERNGVAVSVLQAAEGKAERLREVQPLRPELAGRGGFDEGPAIEPAAKECGACEGQLRAVKGKWVCMDLACGMCGQEQGRV